ANIAINKNGWRLVKRPFTFMILPANNALKFVIKTLPEKECIIKELLALRKGDELVLQNILDTIALKGEGIFTIETKGITPFTSIFSNLKARNQIGNNILMHTDDSKVDNTIENEIK